MKAQKRINLQEISANELEKDALADLSADVSEELLDSFLKDGPFKDLPVFGYIAKSWKAGLDIKNFLFQRKLIGYLSEISTLDEAERKKLSSELSEMRNRDEFSATIVNIIDRCDEIEKVRLIAAATICFVKDKFELEDFREVILSISQLFLKDIEQLGQNIYYDKNYYRGQVKSGAWVLKDVSYSCISRHLTAGCLYMEMNGPVATPLAGNILHVLEEYKTMKKPS